MFTGMPTGVTLQTRKTVRTLVDLLELSMRAATQKARKAGAQAAMVAVFGFFALTWAELAVFLAITAAVPAYGAALATLGANALVLAVALAAIAGAERRRDLGKVVELKRDEARHELEAVKSELVESTTALVQSKVVVPYRKAKMPVAIVGTFVAGMFIAKAFVPSPSRHSRL